MGGARKIGTTVVIEDVAFPIEHLAAGTVFLEKAMRQHGYAEGIIFGHALDGNLHFTFTQDFGAPAEVARYQALMEEVCEVVVRRFDGSLKGEHGTGRNMAPFVELEWGAKAYGLMRRVKALFDPKGILNPGVILNDDPKAYLKDLKPLPQVDPLVDKCIECGFCEPKCPSRPVTTTPRQRITIQREIARLCGPAEDPARQARLAEDFVYLGEQTCATDGLCATACPVSIDTGEYVKELRKAGWSEKARGPGRGGSPTTSPAPRPGRGVAWRPPTRPTRCWATRLMGALSRGRARAWRASGCRSGTRPCPGRPRRRSS